MSVILAGGKGTRLGERVTKGCIKVMGEKTLFEILISKCSGPIAVMTSPLNHNEVADFLEEHENFGKEIALFDQRLVDGKPCGNGMVFHDLYDSGILLQWKERGLKSLVVMPVDDPLADPRDERLIPKNEELVLRCVNPLIGDMGLVLEKGSKVEVEEYTERKSEGNLGYSGVFGCTMEFALKVKDVRLPWHEVIRAGAKQREKFVLDLFPLAETHRIIEVGTEEFMPVKDPESLKKVREILG